MAATEAELLELAEQHEPYPSGKICAEDMYLFCDKHPECLSRFAATVLKSRQDPAFGEIELINTGE